METRELFEAKLSNLYETVDYSEKIIPQLLQQGNKSQTSELLAAQGDLLRKIKRNLITFTDRHSIRRDVEMPASLETLIRRTDKYLDESDGHASGHIPVLRAAREMLMQILSEYIAVETYAGDLDYDDFARSARATIALLFEKLEKIKTELQRFSKEKA